MAAAEEIFLDHPIKSDDDKRRESDGDKEMNADGDENMAG